MEPGDSPPPPPPPEESPVPGWNPGSNAPPRWNPGGPGSPPGWNPAPRKGDWPPPPPPGWPAPPAGYPPNAAPGAYWNPAVPGTHAGGWSTGSGLRPRGVGELLDGAFTLYRRNFMLLVAIAAVVQVPFALLSLLAFEVADIGGRITSLQTLTRQISNQGNTITPDQTSQLLSDIGAAIAYFAAIYVVQFLVVYPLSQAATTTAVSARYLDQATSVRASYAAALARWRALVAMVMWLVLMVAGPLAAGILFAVATGSTAFLALMVLAVFVFAAIVLVRTTVAPQAIVLEKLNGWAGIRRSFHLSNRSAWRIFGIRLLLGLIQGIAGGVIILPVNAVVAGASLTTQNVVGQVGQAVVAVFIAPITLVTLTLLYYDLRIRREGFDIEMLASSL